MHVGSSSVASTGSLSFSLPPHSVMPELPLTGDAMDRHFIESALGDDNTIETASRASRSTASTTNGSSGKNKDWRLKMNRLLSETPISELDPAQIPISVMLNVSKSNTSMLWSSILMCPQMTDYFQYVFR